MNLEPAVLAPAAPDSRQQGVRWRTPGVLRRTLWVLIALLCISLFVAGVPVRFANLQAVCPQLACTDGRMTADQALSLWADGLTPTTYAALSVGWLVAATLVWSSVSLLIFLGVADSWMSWFVSLFLMTGGVTFSPVVVDALAAAYPALALPIQLVKHLALICLFLFFCLFPDGHFAPRWTRYVVLIYPFLVLTSGLFPGSVMDIVTWSPLVNWLVLAPNFAVIGFAQVFRYRHTSSLQQRQQTKWVMYGAFVALVGLITLLLAVEVLRPGLNQPGSLARLMIEATFTLLMLLIPLTVGVAVLRYRVYAIDFIIHRTLVYGALTAGVVGVYVVVVGYLGALFRAEGNLVISLVATGIVAVVFQPLRAWLQRGVNRLLYGERDEPYAVIARLGQRVEATMAPDAVLPTIVDTVAHALKLPYAAIALHYADGVRVVAASGPEQPISARLPLRYQGEIVGHLLLAARTPGEAFTPADHALLEVLADQAGVAAHAVRLTGALQETGAALQSARERLVTAREEERRRLRRDLHDGIGPTLASLAQRLDLARGLVARDPAAAEQLLGDLKAQVKDTVGDIRCLVYALRPPVLDEFGLVSALREHAAQLGQGGHVHITIDAPELLPPLPAAVEVAAYRIVQEALTNVVRHAEATRCHITVALVAGVGRPALRVAIGDDGRGLPPELSSGVGLRSMRERATELGGTCAIRGRAGGGTEVVAMLPLAQA